MTNLFCKVSSFQKFGSIDVASELGLGEQTLEKTFPVRPGSWNVYFIGETEIDHLIESGDLDEDAEPPCQLLLVHADADGQFSGELPKLRKAAEVALEGARFTAATGEMSTALQGESGFYDHLDGVHGLLENGKGVHIMLDGDGTATAWIEDTKSPRLVLVEIR